MPSEVLRVSGKTVVQIVAEPELLVLVAHFDLCLILYVLLLMYINQIAVEKADPAMNQKIAAMFSAIINSA